MKGKIFLVIIFLLSGVKCVYAGEQYIVKFNNSVQLYSAVPEYRNFCTATYEELQEYLAAGIVEYYEKDVEIQLFDTYVTDVAAGQWNLETINLKKMWDIGCFGNEVRVGVIDSGCYSHPDLKKNLIAGRNYTSSDESDTNDNIGHGTFVSGIIASESNGEYITGIAHRAKIVPLKCFDKYYNPPASVLANAIYDAIDIFGCDVINMSFGMSKSYANNTFQLSVAYALSKGCIVVAAVGNDGNTSVYYPANYDGVIGVGAVDSNREITWFSQKNSTVDVMAPGMGLKSVSISGYSENAGTSFAAPHVTAVAAIAKCMDKSITPEKFNQLIQSTSAKVSGQSGYTTEYGHGILDASYLGDKLLEGRKAFISPITDGTVKIYNCSDEDLDAELIRANYAGSKLTGIFNERIKKSPGATETIRLNAGNNMKIMLWDNMHNMNPLALYR